jgi:flagellar motility protein MotE (MotC chaperone)
MNQKIPARHENGQSFFLSELLGAKIMLKGKKIGNLRDLIIKENGALPHVTHLYISLPFGMSAVIPWEEIGTFIAREKKITVVADDISQYKGEPDASAVMLKDHIIDKKAIDLKGRELEVVYDVKLAVRGGRLYVTDVDLSRYGLLRRMHLTKLANFIYNLAKNIQDQTVSWKYIQPLPEKIGRFQGDVKLNILKEKLADMHPVDLADILEEMEPNQRVEIFEKLDPEQASDTLEEIDPNAQRDLVESLKIEKVALLVDEMTTGQAADVLSVLSVSEADAILKRLNPENARKIRTIIDHHEENILDFATQDFISFSPEVTVEQAQEQYRFIAKGKDVVMYLYILDNEKHILGVLDIKELLIAEEQAFLKDVMVQNVISLAHNSTLRKASEFFTRYNFLALPITDADNKIMGAVTYRDIMGLRHRYIE